MVFAFFPGGEGGWIVERVALVLHFNSNYSKWWTSKFKIVSVIHVIRPVLQTSGYISLYLVYIRQYILNTIITSAYFVTLFSLHEIKSHCIVCVLSKSNL